MTGIRHVLVTGSSGLVGCAVMKKSGKYDMRFIGVTSVDADLRDYRQVVDMLEKCQLDGPLYGIIHLAANVGGLFKNISQPVNMFEDNILMNTNILRAAHAANIDNVMMCLSTCIFPDDVTYPITAKSLHNGPPHQSNEAYAYAKRMCEVATRAYQKQYGRRYFCIVPTNIYGPHDNFDINNGHVVPSLIHKCWLAKRYNKPFVVAGDGTPLRQFIYSDDLADLIVWAFDKYKTIEVPFIACPPYSEVPISYVVETIAKLLDYSEHIVYDTSKPNGQYKKTTSSHDTEEAMNQCNLSLTPIESGLQSAVQYFRMHVAN